MKKLILVAIILAAAYFGGVGTGVIPARTAGSIQAATDAGQTLSTAFESRQSDIQIQGKGTVSRILADDNEGSRHQRFILEMASGQTLLIAHNIDLAPRIASIKVGDVVEFYGEYEWNPKGGVIHWTHHDPRGQHVSGWLKHNGRTYQ